ncbi:MAG: glycosyltransferase [Myxococcota bacterium]
MLHVVPYFPPSQAGGGIREAAAALAVAQAGAGCRVTVLCTDVGSRRARRAPADFPGIEIHAFPNLSNALAWDDVTLPLGARAWARRNAAGFDAVHLHGHRHLAALLVSRARGARPYVLSTHGTALRIERRQGIKRVLDRLAGDRILHGAARVLAVSGVEEEQLLSLGVPADRIRRTANPVDASRILPLPARGAFRRTHGIAETARVILFLGRLTPNKRPGALLRAVAPLGNAVLVLAGPDGGALASLQEAARARALGERVIFTGALDDAGRREALADADVLALPSAHEIFGLAAMEGLLAGLVPVVCAGTGCAERIQSWQAGVIAEAADDAALGRALREALDAGEAGRERALRGAR